MNSENQPRQQGDTYMSIVLALIGAIIAWSALLVGAVERVLVKRQTPDPFPYWIAAGRLGLLGAWLLFTFAHPFLCKKVAHKRCISGAKAMHKQHFSLSLSS
jgi:hypothetical protein